MRLFVARGKLGREHKVRGNVSSRHGLLKTGQACHLFTPDTVQAFFLSRLVKHQHILHNVISNMFFDFEYINLKGRRKNQNFHLTITVKPELFPSF